MLPGLLAAVIAMVAGSCSGVERGIPMIRTQVGASTGVGTLIDIAAYVPDCNRWLADKRGLLRRQRCPLLVEMDVSSPCRGQVLGDKRTPPLIGAAPAAAKSAPRIVCENDEHGSAAEVRSRHALS
jgi:hypothetical protein